MGVKKLLDLSGRNALVTGGSRGLGLQIAEALVEMGAKVAITARKKDELDSALSRLGTSGKAFVSDIGKREGIAPLVDDVVKQCGRIDILVNNAGATWGAPAEDHPLEAWDKVMNLNIRSLFLYAQAVAKASMIPNKGGRIINIASIAGLAGSLDMKFIAYGTSKGAVVNFTRTLAGEWGPYGITVNALAPGFFPSKMTAGVLKTYGAD